MPTIPAGGQVFDVAFHPSETLVFAALVTGKVKAFRYDDDTASEHSTAFSARPMKKPCRTLTVTEDGSHLWCAGKGKALHSIDLATSTIASEKIAAHDAAISRIRALTPQLIISGDDDGVVKLWDTRTATSTRSYDHHFDFISDYLPLIPKKQVVVTSGDGSLSVLDIRASKSKPIAHSEDQEDELLSILPIRGGAKSVVGTQLGILSVFDSKLGWGDCVDRIKGHPYSIDALCALPSSHPSSHSTILTGSSDGFVRALQLYPTQLLGVVADHGDFPVERIHIDRGGEGSWVGSVGHDENIMLTNLEKAMQFDREGEGGEPSDVDEVLGGDSDSKSGDEPIDEKPEALMQDVDEAKLDESDDDSDAPKEEKKRKRKDKDPMKKKKKQKGGEVDVDPQFFAGL